ncbi:EamA family transporter [Bacillus sp. SG-1]|uniref:EamA family transporter n=1 Tax=Bacillus sp. SG-1 TaxID=161544 RepID=UPI000313E7CA|nr:EamA family transporter [Bacillus sp. SG-1]
MKWKYLLAVFIGACSYGVLSTVVKLSYLDGVKKNELIVAQFFAGWLMITLIYLFKNNRPKISLRKKVLLMVGGIPSGLVGVYYYTSLETVEASFAIILLFQFVWMGIGIDSIFTRRLPDKKTTGSIIILLLGTVLSSGISLQGAIDSVDFRGIVFGLLAAACFALFIFANARVAPEIGAAQRSFYMVSGSFFIVLLILIPAVMTQGIGSPGSLWIYGVILGFFGVFIPPFLFAYGMPHIGSGIGSILGSAELPVTILLSMLILHEIVSGLQWIGILLILMAIILSNAPYKIRQADQTMG